MNFFQQKSRQYLYQTLAASLCLFSFVNQGQQVSAKCENQTLLYKLVEGKLVGLDGQKFAKSEVQAQFEQWRKKSSNELKPFLDQEDSFNCR